ncbi:hypothetical protein [Streptomyces sp. NPDC055400]
MGTAAFADEVLAPSVPLRPLLNGAGTRPLPDLCDAIAHALPDGNRAGENLMLLARTKALPQDRVLPLSLPAGPAELVGNAVRYGTPSLQLRTCYDDLLNPPASGGASRVCVAVSAVGDGDGRRGPLQPHVLHVAAVARDRDEMLARM